MELNEIQEQCANDSRRWFPDTVSRLGFVALAIGGEAGEFCNIVKKVERGSHSLDKLRDEAALELADVLVYLCDAASILGMDLETLYHQKREYNETRFGRGR